MALFAVGLGIYDVFRAADEVSSSEIFAFQCGLTTALGVLAIVMIIRYSRALRSEKALQIRRNKENDERMKAIRAKADMPTVLIFSVAIIAAGSSSAIQTRSFSIP